MRSLRLAFVALTTLIACGGSGGDGDAGVPNGGLTPRSGLVIVEEPGLQATEFSRALCTKLFECGGEELGALTQDECALYFALPCFFFATLTAEDGLADCIASIREGECRNGGVVSDVCQAAFIRARARETGIPLQEMQLGMCGDGVECANGMVCSGAFNNGCGMCLTVPGLGDSCEGSTCVTGYCDDATLICTEKKPDGAACSVDEECETYDCDAEGLCAPISVEHGCTLDEHCDTGRCEDGHCADAVPPGGACESGLECEEGICDEGICKLIARCSLGEAGEGCGPIGCRGNLECVGGVCTQPMEVPGPNGATCNGPQDCSSGYCAFAGSGMPMCAAKELGMPCDGDDQCESGACVGFRCTGGGICAE